MLDRKYSRSHTAIRFPPLPQSAATVKLKCESCRFKREEVTANKSMPSRFDRAVSSGEA